MRCCKLIVTLVSVALFLNFWCVYFRLDKLYLLRGIVGYLQAYNYVIFFLWNYYYDELCSFFLSVSIQLLFVFFFRPPLYKVWNKVRQISKKKSKGSGHHSKRCIDLTEADWCSGRTQAVMFIILFLL